MSRIDPRLLALAKAPLRTASLNSLLVARQPMPPHAAPLRLVPPPVEPASAPVPAATAAPIAAEAATPPLAPRAEAAVESELPPAAPETLPSGADAVPGPVAEDEPDLVVTADGEVAQDEEADRRNNGRKTQMIPASVTWRGMQMPPIAGVVKDMSMTGVRLQLPPKKFGVVGSVGDVPDHFILILRNEQIQYECEVAWRNASQLGAKFLGRARAIAAEYKSKRGY